MPWPVSWLTGGARARPCLPGRANGQWFPAPWPARGTGRELPDHSGEGRSGLGPPDEGLSPVFPNTTARSLYRSGGPAARGRRYPSVAPDGRLCLRYR
ncbi:protein of unknown function [Streptantibioticus cattleyicolor NRRL 8057 = DSM 46488]|nr:protein of unknown function [Streptantibioticus cattleyicolor NRRL 8057 = DSM 46488]